MTFSPVYRGGAATTMAPVQHAVNWETAMARRFMEPPNEHDWLVLVPSDYHLRPILSGFDGV